jgi:16S rRNA (cytidine1402-2'-O)-methyltransferase
LWIQKSYQNEEQGCLYLIPTPIGNLQDMTERAVATLRTVDYIAAEDTRRTKTLLHVFDIQRPLVSYHEHNKLRSGEQILLDLKAGMRVALVTDAGLPGISDPGEDLVRSATEALIPVISLPGPNAALTALIASGLPSDHFLFFGFLERKKKKRREQLDELRSFPYTMLYYEAPHRIRETLEDMLAVWGERKVCLVRELSKKHEEYRRGDLSAVIASLDTEEAKGEICVVVEGQSGGSLQGADERHWWAEMSVIEHIEHYIRQGFSSKEAIKKTAQDRSLPKRDVYQAYHLPEA